MDTPKEIESVEWNDQEKTWVTRKITVDEYHVFTE